jgi:hypothetical protein
LEEQEEWEQVLDAALEERIAGRSAGLKPGATHAGSAAHRALRARPARSTEWKYIKVPQIEFQGLQPVRLADLAAFQASALW